VGGVEFFLKEKHAYTNSSCSQLTMITRTQSNKQENVNKLEKDMPCSLG